jgi:hypothetical protein
MLFGGREQTIVDIEWNFLEAECKGVKVEKSRIRTDGIKDKRKTEAEV